jgi:hypothetical protein
MYYFEKKNLKHMLRFTQISILFLSYVCLIVSPGVYERKCIKASDSNSK